MSDLPEPLVPADCDLRDLPGFMLNTERLLASELWALATGDEIKAALSLWCRAWKQVPAASLPADRRIIAAFAGMSAEALFNRHQIVMRGFVKCSDGRWYHRFLAAEAIIAWNRRLKERTRKSIYQGSEWDSIRRSVFERDDFTCKYCGQRGGKLECDHVFPIAKGGKTEMSNLVAACATCNRSKGSRLLSEWLQ